jgi:hypothetical protein
MARMREEGNFKKNIRIVVTYGYLLYTCLWLQNSSKTLPVFCKILPCLLKWHRQSSCTVVVVWPHQTISFISIDHAHGQQRIYLDFWRFGLYMTPNYLGPGFSLCTGVWFNHKSFTQTINHFFLTDQVRTSSGKVRGEQILRDSTDDVACHFVHSQRETIYWSQSTIHQRQSGKKKSEVEMHNNSTLLISLCIHYLVLWFLNLMTMSANLHSRKRGPLEQSPSTLNYWPWLSLACDCFRRWTSLLY